MANTESVHIKMDPEFKRKVDAYCKKYGVSMSEAIRASLRDTLTMAGYFDDGAERCSAHMTT